MTNRPSGDDGGGCSQSMKQSICLKSTSQLRITLSLLLNRSWISSKVKPLVSGRQKYVQAVPAKTKKRRREKKSECQQKAKEPSERGISTCTSFRSQCCRRRTRARVSRRPSKKERERSSPAAVVHVGHRKASRRPVLDHRAVSRRGRSSGTSMGLHQ